MAVLDIVFSYLTPAQYRRYSSHNLCQALTSLGRFVMEFCGGGTLPVNQASGSSFLIERTYTSVPSQTLFDEGLLISTCSIKEFSVA
jgi:hypothetical protein